MKSNSHIRYDQALVTGATSGIGEALARLLARKEISLILTGRDSTKLDKLKRELEKITDVKTLAADLNDETQRQHLISLIHQNCPDLIINNAGIGLYGYALSHSTKSQLNVLDTNANAVLEITLESARALLKKDKKGTIVNVSSTASFMLFPCFSVYTASKAFVNQFSESFDFEMRPFGIRVLIACPGMVKTKFRRRSGGQEKVSVPPSSSVMSAEFAANEIWTQCQTLKTIHLFNWRYRIACFLTRYLLPKKWVGNYLKKNILNRVDPTEFL